MKNIENYGVKKLNSKEIIHIEGGNWWAVALFIADMIGDAVDNPDDFKAGYNAVVVHH